MGDVRALFNGRIDDAVSVVREMISDGVDGIVIQAVLNGGKDFSVCVLGKVDLPDAAYFALVLQDLALSRRREERE